MSRVLTGFQCGHLDFSCFQKPEEGVVKNISHHELQEVAEYLKQFLPGFKQEHLGSANFGRQSGLTERHMYQAVELEYPPTRSTLYLFRVKAGPGDDEKEFDGHGAYEWRFVGHCIGWPMQYHYVMWTGD